MDITLIKCHKPCGGEDAEYIKKIDLNNKLSPPHRSLYLIDNVDALASIPKEFAVVVMAKNAKRAIDEILEIPEYYNKPPILTILAESKLAYNAKIAHYASHFLSEAAYLTKDQTCRYFTALQEIVLNAIEHGNLKLTKDKKELIKKGVWFEDFREIVDKAMTSKTSSEKLVLVKVYLDYERKCIVTHVKDEGSGFEVEEISLEKEVSLDAHGRGLSLLQGLTDGCHFTQNGRCSEFLFNAEYLRTGAINDTEYDIDYIKTHGKILVVDDQLTNLEVVKYYLTSAGYENVYKAQSGKEAIKIAKEIDPDIILMDVVMPEMDGFTTSRHIKLDEHLKNTPILFLTALNKNENRIQGYQSGAVDYVIKPVEKEELLARTQTHLQNSLFVKNIRQNLNRINNDMEKAKKSQLDLLPHEEDLEVLEVKHDLNVDAYFKACEELAGDYWNVEEVGHSTVLIISADFTGHGIAASLNTIRLHGILSDAYKLLPDLEAFVLFINERLKFVLSLQDFASFVCVLLDTSTGDIEYVGCGAPPMVVIPGDKKKASEVLNCDGLPLGLVDNSSMNVEIKKGKLSNGDSLFLYSDGLVEATHKGTGEMWGTQGLLDILDDMNKNRTYPCLDDVKESFFDTVEQPLKDDLTMLYITYKEDTNKELLHNYMNPDEFAEELEG